MKQAGKALCVALTLATSHVYADGLADKLTLKGFFSVDATITDNAGANLPRPNERDAGLKKNDASFDGSVYGVHADLDITEALSAGIQVIGTGQTAQNFSPETEWAYLTYNFNSDLYLRAGLFKLPFLQGTELRYIGQSRLWARPVVPASGAGGFDSYTGAELYYNTWAGDFDIQWHASYGKPDHDKDSITDTRVMLGSLQLEHGNGDIRFSLLNANFDVSNEDGILLKPDASMLMGSIEGKYHINNWLINAGFVTGSADNHPDEEMRYLSIGYSTGSFTPYILHYQKNMDFETLNTGQPKGPPPVSGMIISPPPLKEEPREGLRKEKGYALGLRYEISPSLSLKFQWDYQKEKDDSFANSPTRKKESNIYTIVFEGVF